MSAEVVAGLVQRWLPGGRRRRAKHTAVHAWPATCAPPRHSG